MTGYSVLISTGRGTNFKASSTDRIETETVMAGGDVRHRWLCLYLVGHMVRDGDGERWSQLSIYI